MIIYIKTARVKFFLICVVIRWINKYKCTVWQSINDRLKILRL